MPVIEMFISFLSLLFLRLLLFLSILLLLVLSLQQTLDQVWLLVSFLIFLLFIEAQTHESLFSRFFKIPCGKLSVTLSNPNAASSSPIAW